MTMTTGKAARELGVSPRTVARWIQGGHLEAMRTPTGRLLIERSAVEAALRPVNSVNSMNSDMQKGEGA